MTNNSNQIKVVDSNSQKQIIDKLKPFLINDGGNIEFVK